jgi:hypothetical protein
MDFTGIADMATIPGRLLYQVLAIGTILMWGVQMDLYSDPDLTSALNAIGILNKHATLI